VKDQYKPIITVHNHQSRLPASQSLSAGIRLQLSRNRQLGKDTQPLPSNAVSKGERRREKERKRYRGTHTEVWYIELFLKKSRSPSM